MYQFFHIESYALKSSNNKAPHRYKKEAPEGGSVDSSDRSNRYISKSKPSRESKLNASEVMAEALRLEGNCPHVLNPLEPNFIYGSKDDAVNIMPTLNRMMDEFKTPLTMKNGNVVQRKLREDTHLLLAGVASYPREEYENNPDAYIKWRTDAVDYLKNKYSSKLVSIVEHLDEEHPHIHFYCIDLENANIKLSHDGYIAQAEAARTDPKKRMTKEATDAYKEAMIKVQDDYFKHVGFVNGLSRLGPKRQRLSRDEWKAVKKANKITSELQRDVDNVAADILENANVKARNTINEARDKLDKANAIEVENNRLTQRLIADDKNFSENRRAIQDMLLKQKNKQKEDYDFHVLTLKAEFKKQLEAAIKEKKNY
ncbi:MAG: plasmid recombination protein [Giesbergeria sp.]|uniref:plasmid recombination protein n=1 Tax=Giesbergeria sp. TaxID=2818473 RepID=UPI0026304A94|nr:plasmid recombination protein [Giesbergeria sp.]MDD2610907.1 plasmid recombination protein [Giesbergeria sp.]